MDHSKARKHFYYGRVTPNTRMVNFRIPYDLLAQVDALRGEDSRTAVILDALRTLVAERGKAPLHSMGEVNGAFASKAL